MYKKIFVLRIDVDTVKGLEKGVPNLLRTVGTKYKINFFINFGYETNLFEFLKNFRKNKRALNLIKTRGFFQTLKGLRRKKIDIVHKNLIKKIIRQGHGVYLHGGMDHGKWIYSFPNTSPDKVRDDILSARACFKKFINRPPSGFCSPGFRWDYRLLRILDDLKFKFASDLSGNKPFYPKIKGRKFKCLQIPVNKKLNIELLNSKGKTDEEIFKMVAEEMKRSDFVSIYGHAVYEGIKKTGLLLSILKKAEKNNFKILTFDQINLTFKDLRK